MRAGQSGREQSEGGQHGGRELATEPLSHSRLTAPPLPGTYMWVLGCHVTMAWTEKAELARGRALSRALC